MTVYLPCRHCGRPCQNGTGRAAHERACRRARGSLGLAGPVVAPVAMSAAPATRPGLRSPDGVRVCGKCKDEYPVGGLADHLATCAQSATAELARLNRGVELETKRPAPPACRRCGRRFERRHGPGRYPAFCKECK